MREIIERCAYDGNISVAALVGTRQLRRHAYPRFRAIYEVRQLRMANGKPPSWPRIGLWFGGRDHTTCISAARRWTEMLAANGG